MRRRYRQLGPAVRRSSVGACARHSWLPSPQRALTIWQPTDSTGQSRTYPSPRSPAREPSSKASIGSLECFQAPGAPRCVRATSVPLRMASAGQRRSIAARTQPRELGSPYRNKPHSTHGKNGVGVRVRWGFHTNDQVTRSLRVTQQDRPARLPLAILGCSRAA